MNKYINKFKNIKYIIINKKNNWNSIYLNLVNRIYNLNIKYRLINKEFILFKQNIKKMNIILKIFLNNN